MEKKKRGDPSARKISKGDITVKNINFIYIGSISIMEKDLLKRCMTLSISGEHNAYTLYRYMPKWILQKLEKQMKAAMKKYCEYPLFEI